ncbi:hypothetical protein M5W68_17835 [Paenibacillus larvae]|uniref:hypothetical protein n=1 Tax=Paenibacillus larvae TaxID=1464 RepID=UPI002282432C|nr:hypothetical protein [Paenibacillus larvae]MCY9511755.1 hypothetical protein [Paenibacillus larvae]MCY9526914.1 hypothetical protein [Paenibacillus larvae]
MESFLFRCVELGKTELIMKAINILVDHPRYTELLFSMAENLYLSGYAKESVLFYEEVIEGEKYNHSDRIPALSTLEHSQSSNKKNMLP